MVKGKAWFPKCEKVLYESVFHNPNGQMASWLMASYHVAAHSLVEIVVQGKSFTGFEGIAAVFLFRHYLELVLKSIAVNLGRLETKEKNLPKDKWREWPSNEHKLAVLWDEVKTEFPKKMGQDWWESLDTKFIDKCVTEFHDIDPSSQRFRYPHERKITRDELKHLGVSWSALLRTIDHSWDVLDNMDGDAEFVYNQNKLGP